MDSITFEAPTELVYVVGTNQTDDIMKLLVADFAWISRYSRFFESVIAATSMPELTSIDYSSDTCRYEPLLSPRAHAGIVGIIRRSRSVGGQHKFGNKILSSNQI